MDQLAREAAGGHIAQRDGNPMLAVVPGAQQYPPDQINQMTAGQHQSAISHSTSEVDVLNGIFSGHHPSLGHGFEELFQGYKDTLPSASPEAFADKIHQIAAGLKKKMYEAEARQDFQRAFELHKAWKSNLDVLQKWQAAAKHIPHKQLWKLHKQSIFEADGDNNGINLSQMVLQAASSDTFMSSLGALMGVS